MEAANRVITDTLIYRWACQCGAFFDERVYYCTALNGERLKRKDPVQAAAVALFRDRHSRNGHAWVGRALSRELHFSTPTHEQPSLAASVAATFMPTDS